MPALTPLAWATATMAPHTTSRGNTGPIGGECGRRTTAVTVPLRCADSQDTPLEKPPTKKKTGMTWKSQVSQRDQGARSSRWL